jgi:hypothetical protein
VALEAVLPHDKVGRSVVNAKDGKDILTPAADKWGVWTMLTGFSAGGFLVGEDYRWSENS